MNMQITDQVLFKEKIKLSKSSPSFVIKNINSLLLSFTLIKRDLEGVVVGKVQSEVQFCTGIAGVFHSYNAHSLIWECTKPFRCKCDSINSCGCVD